MAQTDLRFTFESASNVSSDPGQHNHFDVVEFKLTEGLSECFRLEVELLSNDPAVDFKAIVDQGATFTIWQGANPVRHIHGLVSDFSQSDTGFRRTRYHAVVEPQLTRTQLRSDWRVFQQKAVPAILGEILKADQIVNYTLNAQHEHLQREYCMQAGDSDFGFMARLAAEEGFIYRFAHSRGNHQLILADVVQNYGAIQSASSLSQQEEPADTASSVLYQPNPGGDRQQPALRTFTYREQVRTASQTQRDYTFKNPPYDQQHTSYGHNLAHQSQHYERYDYPGRYKQDAAGKPFTETRILSLRRDAQIAVAEGDDARLEPGLAFQLTGHPREDMNILWRPVRIEHSGKQYTSAEEEAATAQVGTSYTQMAELVPATADWKAPIPPKPLITGPLIAHVTGASDEEIYTDEYGRVKVQFPWDRLGRDDEHSSCWIRVAQNWAGAAWGHIAIPRIGQEVIVDFLDGDPDQPIVSGRTYDAQHPTPYKLPALKTQMTIKSKEHKGSGYNELLIDDTTGEIKTQLHSTYGATQLTMGYLTHPRQGDGTGEERGHGFELRTDEWGAIRAARGMYISADLRESAQGKQLDMQEALQQLDEARSVAASLQEAAKVAKAELADLQTQKKLLAETLEELKQAAIVMNAPEGIAITSPKSVQTHAGENLIFTSAQQTDISTMHKVTVNAGDDISLFAVRQGMKLIANKGAVDIQAQHHEMHLLAEQDMTFKSTLGTVEIAAKKQLVLKCGGAYIKLENGNIELGCPGDVILRSASMNCLGPSSLASLTPPQAGPFGEFFVLTDKRTGVILPYARYRVTTADGNVYTGRTDKDGKTMMVHTATPQKIVFEMLE